MNLSDFKSIFWFEYSHRMLGRLIGLVFLLPFLYFFWKKKIPPGLTPKLFVMFALGALQGLLGWYMVKSGLVSNPHVSQYRLTAHLLSAIVIYGFILWTILDLNHNDHSDVKTQMVNLSVLNMSWIPNKGTIPVILIVGALLINPGQRNR